MIQLEEFLSKLKENDIIWQEFQNTFLISSKYDQLFFQLNKFLDSKGYQIIHSYHHETLKLEYIVYYKGCIIDLEIGDLFSNPYWNIILNCFKELNSKL